MSVSGAGNRVPSYQREMNEMRTEIRKLWQALGKQQAMPPVQKQMPFSWSGAVSGAKTSGPWHAEDILTITGCTIGLEVAGGSQTSVALRVNGVTVDTYFIAAGATRGGAQSNHNVNLGDRVQLYVVGGGGTNLTAFLSYITNHGW